MSRITAGVKWTVGLGAPVLAFVAISSALVHASAGYLAAALVGAAAFPVLPGVWHLIGELRRRRRTATGKSALTGLDRWLLRSWVVATVTIAGVWLVLGGKLGRVMHDHYDWPVHAIRGYQAPRIPAVSARTRPALEMVGDDAQFVAVIDGRYAQDLDVVDLARRAVPIPIDAKHEVGDYAYVAAHTESKGGFGCWALTMDQRPYPPDHVLRNVHGQAEFRLGDMLCQWEDGPGAMSRARAAMHRHMGPHLARVLARVPGPAFFIFAVLSYPPAPFEDAVMSVSATHDRATITTSLRAHSPAEASILALQARDEISAWGKVDLHDRVKTNVQGTLVTATVVVSRKELETLAVAARQWLPPDLAATMK